MTKEEILDLALAGAGHGGEPLTTEETTIAILYLTRLAWRIRHAHPETNPRQHPTPSDLTIASLRTARDYIERGI